MTRITCFSLVAASAIFGAAPSPAHAAPANTAAASYNPSTGELFLDLGANIRQASFGAAGLFDVSQHPAIPIDMAASQFDHDVVAFVSFTGLPAGTFNLGPILPPGLSLDALGSSYSLAGKAPIPTPFGPPPTNAPLPDKTAAAHYDPLTGDVTIALGPNVLIFGVGAEGLINMNATPRIQGQLFGAVTPDSLSFHAFDMSPGSFNLGPVLAPHLSADQIQFSYTIRGATIDTGPTIAASVAIVPEPRTLLLAGLALAVALRQPFVTPSMRRR
jgi:hypothetical protein